MSGKSQIEWTEQTWNPTTGCDKVSLGCKYCYAETMSRRLKAMGAKGYEDGFAVRQHPERLQQPLNTKRSTVYFVNSMSDLFHPDIEFDFIDQVFETIKQTPQHTYQILTKRPQVMKDYFANRDSVAPINTWLGTSVENKKYGLPRIDILRDIPCSTRFLSCEPLLENLGKLDLRNIHWVIVGGESGSKARPMRPSWAINIKDQCQQQSVPFFFKQWGAWSDERVKRSKKANGRLLEGQLWNNYPQRKIT